MFIVFVFCVLVGYVFIVFVYCVWCLVCFVFGFVMCAFCVCVCMVMNKYSHFISCFFQTRIVTDDPEMKIVTKLKHDLTSLARPVTHEPSQFHVVT